MTNKKTVVINCRECGLSFDVRPYVQDRLEKFGHQLPKLCKHCRDLRNTMVSINTCGGCGKQIELNGLQARRLKLKLGSNYKSRVTLCSECMKLKFTVAEGFTCRDCGKAFVLDGLQIQRLKQKIGDAYKAPRHCISCKKLKKNAVDSKTDIKKGGVTE